MKKEWVLLAGVALLTTTLSLLVVRWLSPQLLGIPVDLQLVQVSETLPPFFEGVFREADYASEELLLKDPYTNVRMKPLLKEDSGVGPHDILGFRNPAIPNNVDIITIGDSQTYGIGDALVNNWPSQLSEMLGPVKPTVYCMAVGGWGAVQYLNISNKALLFKPRVLIVAFYSGNDPLESFSMAYAVDRWAALRTDPDIDKSDAPKVPPLLSVEDSMQVTFRDGTSVAFTPRGRLAANNNDDPAVRAGYSIMAAVANKISAAAMQQGIPVIFTVIPTRELVYAGKVAQEKILAIETYRQLVVMESENIEQLAASIQALPGARYVDLIKPLQAAAVQNIPLYPRKWDGHPGAAGYRIIAATLAQSIDPLI